MSLYLGMNDGTISDKTLTVFVLIAIILYLICFAFSIIKKVRTKNCQKLSLLGDKENSVCIYIGSNLVKYISEENPYNIQTRIETLMDEYANQKGYIFRSPNIIVSDDLKPNQVLIKDFENDKNKVYFEVFENHIFSFENLNFKGVFSRNYPIFSNPVFFYQKDDFRVNPVRVINNNFDEITAGVQIVDLIVSIYKEVYFNSNVSLPEDYLFLVDEKAYSDYCKNNLCDESVKNEYFLYFANSVINNYVQFSQELPSVEELLYLIKSILDSYSKDQVYDTLQDVINYKNNKEIFLNNLFENEKIYAYTFEQNFIDDFNEYISDENEEDTTKLYSLVSRIEKVVFPNSKVILLCDKEYRTSLDEFMKTHFVFSKVLSFDSIPDTINYEIIGSIK